MCSALKPGREKKSVWCVSNGGLIQAAEWSPCDLPFCEMFLGQPDGNSWGNKKLSCLSGELCLLVASVMEKRLKSVRSLGKEGGCGWESKSRATCFSDDLRSPRNSGQGLSPGERVLPSLWRTSSGKESTTSPAVDFHPPCPAPPLSVGITQLAPSSSTEN